MSLLGDLLRKCFSNPQGTWHEYKDYACVYCGQEICGGLKSESLKKGVGK